MRFVLDLARLDCPRPTEQTGPLSTVAACTFRVPHLDGAKPTGHRRRRSDAALSPCEQRIDVLVV